MEKRQEFVTNSAAATQKIGRIFTKSLKAGDSVLLSGDLGTGKTTFMQGVALGLKIKSRIISPTFVLVRQHDGVLDNLKITMYHADLYRIEDDAKIKNLGLDEMLQDSNGIVFIEWGEKTNNTKYNWEIKFKNIRKNERKIVINKNE